MQNLAKPKKDKDQRGNSKNKVLNKGHPKAKNLPEVDAVDSNPPSDLVLDNDQTREKQLDSKRTY